MGDDDLRLLADGSHPRPWQVLGAHPGHEAGADGVRFRVWAPNARAVVLTGSFSNWHDAAMPMEPIQATGVWERFVPAIGAGERYRFVVSGADGKVRHKADPYGQLMDEPPGSASHVLEPSAYAWSDGAWLREREHRDPQRAPMRVYEVHLGSWRRGPNGERLTYAQLGEQLAEHCTSRGFTHVELLPVTEHPFRGSWGYQVTGFYAPSARFGRPDEMRGMIDLLHRSGIGVILDWVPAHFAPDEHALGRFDGTALFEHPDPMRGAHPDWGTLVFDLGRPEVRGFLIGNARYWLEEFHVDGLRVDAVASMLYLDYSRKAGEWTPNALGGNHDLEAIAFLRELNRRCHDGMPGVVTIAEESTSFPGMTSPEADGGLGFDFKWDLGWMHDTLKYYRGKPPWRWSHRDRITFRGFYLDSESWVLPLSHDEVVHLKRSLLEKMPGDRVQQFANLRSLLANQVGQPGKKLLFMGSELAPEREWDHDGILPWEEAAADPLRVALLRLVDDLGAIYRDSPALWAADHDPDGFAWIDGEGVIDRSVLAWQRRGSVGPGPDELMVIVQNGRSSALRRYRLGLPMAGRWEAVLNTDAERYGGGTAGHATTLEAEERPWAGQPASAVLTLPALAVLFLRPAPEKPAPIDSVGGAALTQDPRELRHGGVR